MTTIRDPNRNTPVTIRGVNTIIVKKTHGHYEILVNGKFHCSCDSPAEVDTEIAELQGGDA